MIVVEELEKEFPAGFRLGPVRFHAEARSTVAVIGKNGSGKSTFFQLITGNLDANKGQVLFQGEKMRPESFKLRRQLGYLPQALELPRWITGIEILRYAAGLYGLQKPNERIDFQLSYWDCLEFARKPLAACSHGMQKRIGLALATLHDPDLLILDEPFSGLDLFHIKALISEITRRQETGKLTILSTHIAPYVAKLCTRAMVIESGQMQELPGWSEQGRDRKTEMIEEWFFGD